jgi:DNA-binding CsgD family transcriptional regulator
MGVSVSTVQTYIKSIYSKLSVNSRGEAVFESRALGLLDRARRD